MGFFSWTCAKTHLPIMADKEGFSDECSQITVVYPNNRTESGTYDGYGRIGDLDLVELAGAAKIVLTKFYNGERYDELGSNHDDLGQGYFHDPELLRKWYSKGGFASYEDYYSAYKNSTG